MKITYLGTAAADGIPAVFCSCPLCRFAEKAGGKDHRTRSQALINDDLLIDFPADTYAHYLTYHFDLPGITELLVTHSHRDHFCPSDLAMRCAPFAHPDELPVMRIYGNESVFQKFYSSIPPTNRATKNFELVPAAPFVPLNVGRYRVVPFAALHDRNQTCLFYGIKLGGKSLLYAHDTGYFPEETWKYLARDKTCYDLVSLDCTLMKHKDGKNHMGLQDDIEVKQRLLETGCADEHTVFVVNHFSHNGDWLHEELEAQAGTHGFVASYDGMEIVF